MSLFLYYLRESCYPGCINRLALNIPESLDCDMEQEYSNFLENFQKGAVTEQNVRATICGFIDVVIKIANENEAVKFALKDFLENQSNPIIFDEIPYDYNIVYNVINTAYLDTYGTIPNISEYTLIMETIGANIKLQKCVLSNNEDTSVGMNEYLENEGNVNNIGSLVDDLQIVSQEDMQYYPYNLAGVSRAAAQMEEID